MSTPVRKPSCLKRSAEKRSSSGAASSSIGGTSEMLPYAQTNVHFPTAKRDLVKTRVTHSPASYDRSPIVVAPNSCALPARGCPGRTYAPDAIGRSIHPSARLRTSTPCPGLVSDEGSSDDSDGLVSPPPERTPMFSDDDRAMMFAAAKKPRRSIRRPSFEEFSSPDEGCLGGF
ncbi:unnamed protein product [Rhizoctonia solani]|uniref:Uncharacterized protein n=2 Tax=Rhizoctonia solani TaxID=456999 RepID=A0A8H3AJA3_9AGAM|nr:hypothetical protein V565_087070 [Rhizoctonia solani 123E]CAE6432874.1 unnamed protein product [Rhizoctonia solani]CAE6522300.1 unnamed protein product [Rhizoctonia solani]